MFTFRYLIPCLGGYSESSLLLEHCTGTRDFSKSLDGRGTVGDSTPAGVCCPESNTLEICWSRISCTFSSGNSVINAGVKTAFWFALWCWQEASDWAGT